MQYLSSIKVGIDISSESRRDIEQAFNQLDVTEGLPLGWEVSELYHTPVNIILIFNVDHLPKEEDYRKVITFLKRRKFITKTV